MNAALVPPDALGLVLRTVTLASALLLVGALPVCGLVLRPLGSLPDGGVLMRRLTAGLRVAVVALAVASVLVLADLAAAVGSVEGPGAGAWATMLSSDFGAWTAVRVPLAVALWFVLPLALLGRQRSAWYAWVVLAAVLTLTMPMTSHATTSGFVGITVDAVHLLAGGVWLTGVVALAVVLPSALRAARASERRSLLLSAARSFSRLAVVAVVIAVATGFVQPMLTGITLSDLPGTTWGAAVTAKTVLVVLVVGAGLVNHRVLIGRLAAARTRAGVTAGSSALLSVVSLEVLLGVAVVLAAALLVSVPQP